jgi:hypothetical protein
MLAAVAIMQIQPYCPLHPPPPHPATHRPTCTMKTKLMLPSPTSCTVQLDSLPAGPTRAASWGLAEMNDTTPAASSACTLLDAFALAPPAE